MHTLVRNLVHGGINQPSKFQNPHRWSSSSPIPDYSRSV